MFDESAGDLTEQLMREAVMIMDASDGDILKMFFEDLNDKCADMDSQAYFNQLFEVAIPSRYSIGN